MSAKETDLKLPNSGAGTQVSARPRHLNVWFKHLRLAARAALRAIIKAFLKYPLYYLNVRFVNIPFWAIGHLGTDADCFLKEGILGRRPKFREIWLVYPEEKVANPCLLDYWREHIRVFSNPLICQVLGALAHDEKLEYDVNEYTNTHQTGQFAVIQKEWGNRPPLLSLKEEHRKRGWDNLRKLGVPADAWFATVHCREAGYYQKVHPAYGNVHDFRDADIETYIPAMKAIAERGGWCIRVGDPTMKPLPKMDMVIDYVHLDIKSDWMDIFLLAACRFHLGSSGVFSVCGAFGVPVAMVNLAPLGGVLIWRPCDIDIPKLVKSDKDGHIHTFKEVLDSPIGNFRYTNLYDEAGVSLVDDSPEDIRDLAIEMMDRVEGKVTYSGEDERLQASFKALMKPGNWSYGSSARVGRAFLRKYAMLLPNESSKNE